MRTRATSSPFHSLSQHTHATSWTAGKPTCPLRPAGHSALVAPQLQMNTAVRSQFASLCPAFLCPLPNEPRMHQLWQLRHVVLTGCNRKFLEKIMPGVRLQLAEADHDAARPPSPA